MKRNIFMTVLVFIGILGFSGCNLDTENNKGFYFDDKKLLKCPNVA